LALSAAVVGDWCERSDVGNQVFELTTAGYATLANWTAYGLGTSSSANPPVTATAGFTFAQASHENRDIGFNSASPGTFVFDGTAAFNNKGSFRLMQEGAGVATLSISGVTLANPRSFSLVTVGIGTYIDAEWDSVIPGLVITATGSGATAVTTLGILSQMTSQYGMSIPQNVGNVGYTTLGLSGPTAVGTGPANASIADGTVGFGQLRRVRFPTAVAATNNQCGFYRNTPYFKVNAGGDYNGGFPVLLAVSISDVTPAQGSLFLGLGNGIANTATLEPSAFTAALLGIEKDSVDANLSVIYNSPGGTPTRVALGAAFVSAQFKAFAVLIDKNQAGTSFNITPYYLDSASDLWVTGSTTVASTNIPTAASTLLAQICIRSSLAASLALSVDDHGMWRGKTAGL